MSHFHIVRCRSCRYEAGVRASYVRCSLPPAAVATEKMTSWRENEGNADGRRLPVTREVRLSLSAARSRNAVMVEMSGLFTKET